MAETGVTEILLHGHGRRWRLLPPTPSEFLTQLAPLPPLVAQLLYNRGISSPIEAASFLNPDEHLLGDPFLLPDMDRAVARIHRALLSGERMAVYGDSDVDGFCGTALLVEGLSDLGGNVIPYVPHRVRDGYGLNPDALKGLSREGVSLLVTVDCGITSLAEIEGAREMGLEVIVTDHHTISSSLPPALAVVDSKRDDSAYPFPQLAGVGVAFKLLQALLQTLGRWEYQREDFLDLVTLGTVADMVPLVGENRYLVERGLRALNNTRRLGLRELVASSGAQLGRLDTNCISWTLAPRLNAAGRMGDAINSYKLLVTQSQEEARMLAQDLEQRNSERQQLCKQVLAKAREQLAAAGTDAPLLMAGGEDFHPGVLGLVAGRIADEFHRPTFLVHTDGSLGRASGRSIPEFDLVAALAECRDVLLQFGGHPMAAGFTLSQDKLEHLYRRLLEIAEERLAGLDLEPRLLVDADVGLSFLSGDVIKMMGKFAPFGVGNSVPTLLSRRVKVADAQRVGTGGEHLRLKLYEEKGGVTWHSIGFGLGRLISEVSSYLDIIYELGVDRWGSEEMVELNILDFAPSPSCE